MNEPILFVYPEYCLLRNAGCKCSLVNCSRPIGSGVQLSKQLNSTQQDKHARMHKVFPGTLHMNHMYCTKLHTCTHVQHTVIATYQCKDEIWF